MENINYYVEESKNLISQNNNEKKEYNENESKNIFDTFNENIKEYKKLIENKNKFEDFINSKKNLSLKYFHIEIDKSRNKLYHKNEIENIDKHSKDINIILNSIKLSQYKLNLDLSKNDKLDFFMPLEERATDLF